MAIHKEEKVEIDVDLMEENIEMIENLNKEKEKKGVTLIINSKNKTYEIDIYSVIAKAGELFRFAAKATVVYLFLRYVVGV